MTTRKSKNQKTDQASKAPKVEVTGTQDLATVGETTTVETTTTTVETTSQSVDTQKSVTEEKTIVEEVAAPTVPEYTVERIVVLLDMSNEVLAKRIATRLAVYFKVVQTATSASELSPVANTLDDVLNLVNRSENVDFIQALKGLINFVNADIEEFGNKSMLSGTRAFRPFLGGCPPQARFLEALKELAPKKTRKMLIGRISPQSVGKFIAEDKVELFMKFFKEAK